MTVIIAVVTVAVVVGITARANLDVARWSGTRGLKVSLVVVFCREKSGGRDDLCGDWSGAPAGLGPEQ